MAYLIETLRSQMITSVHGRRLGLDKDDYAVGPKDLRRQVEDVQTTEGSSLSPYGLTRVLTSGSSQTAIHTLQAPVIGVQKRIFLQSTSTGCQIIRFSGSATVIGASLTTAGSTCINLLKQGANVTLEAVTSALWLLTGMQSSLVSSDHSFISFSTST